MGLWDWITGTFRFMWGYWVILTAIPIAEIIFVEAYQLYK